MKILFIFAVVITLSLSYVVQGRIGTRRVSKEEDLELERQLKVFNKPPVKSFQREDGSIFDCIKIEEQPAFDHPLLRNHTIQLRPSSLPRGMSFSTNSESHPSSVHRKVDCPPRTVPIRRTTKEDLIIAKTLSRQFPTQTHPLDSSSDEVHSFATVGPIKNPAQQYYGARGSVSVYSQAVAPTQYSGAGIWLAGGENGDHDSIHYGWVASPPVYGDNRTRTVTYWNGKGCSDGHCPGFVQVSSKYPIGIELTPTSVQNGIQYVQKIYIDRDPVTGNWWATEDMAGEGPVKLGYWPNKLFTGLAKSASEVHFGGRAYGPSNEFPPTMGSGEFNPPFLQNTSFVAQMKFIDIYTSPVDPADIAMGTTVTHPNCYQAKYLGNQGADRGYTMIFGGPGGTCPLPSSV